MTARYNPAGPIGRRIMAEAVAQRVRERLAECASCGARLTDDERRICADCRPVAAHARHTLAPEGLYR